MTDCAHLHYILHLFLQKSNIPFHFCLKVEVPMKWKKFLRYFVAFYMYFSKCPKVNSVKGQKIRVFAAQSSNLTTEKCLETGSECNVTLVAKVLITLRMSQ